MTRTKGMDTSLQSGLYGCCDLDGPDKSVAELVRSWTDLAQVPPDGKFHGLFWRTCMDNMADAISGFGHHESACIIYRTVIADARAEAEAT